MDTAATLHLFIDEQARRTKALLPLRGIARYQLLADDYGVVAFGGEELPTTVTLHAGKYRLKVASRLGWAASNTLDLELRAGDTAWISLDVDESPRLSQTCHDVLEENVTMTVEPGVYVPGLGGIRIENTCVIGKTSSRTLVHAQKELLIL